MAGAVARVAAAETAAAEAAHNAALSTTGHAARLLARMAGMHDADDGRETAVSTVTAPRLRAGESHDDCGGDADGTTDAVALAAAAETAHDAAPATTGHAARSIERIPGVHGGEGDRLAAVSLVTTLGKKPSNSLKFSVEFACAPRHNKAPASTPGLFAFCNHECINGLS